MILFLTLAVQVSADEIRSSESKESKAKIREIIAKGKIITDFGPNTKSSLRSLLIDHKKELYLCDIVQNYNWESFMILCKDLNIPKDK